MADDPLLLDRTDIRHPGNLLLFLFFTEAHTSLQAIAPSQAASSSQAHGGGSHASHFSQTVRKAVASLRNHPTRIYDAVTLSSVPFVGPALVRVVTQSLWTLRGPLPPSEDDLQIAAAIAEREKKERVAERKKAKEKKEAKMNAGSGGAAASGSAQPQPAAAAEGGGKKRKAAGTSNPKPSPQQPAHENIDLYEVEDQGMPSSKRARQAKEAKEYKPQVGTANYAFLITLYMSTKSGIEYETKETLMKKAETSGLSNKSLFGTGQAGGGNGMHYDGWSSFNKSLVNRTPPLVQAWSNPKKVRLTAEGLSVAAELYKDAVERCKVTAIPNLNPDLDISLKHAPGATGAGAGAGAGVEKGVQQGAGKDRGTRRKSNKSGTDNLVSPSSESPLDHLSELASRSMYAAISRSRGGGMSMLLPNLTGSDPLASGGKKKGDWSRGSRKSRDGSKASLVIVIDSSDENDENEDPRPTPSVPLHPSNNPPGKKDAMEVLMAASRDAQRREIERGSLDSTLTFGDGVASHSGRSTQRAGHAWKIARLRDPRPTLPCLLPPIPPGKTFEEQYEVVMVIDNREQIRREHGKGRVETLEALVQRIRDKGIPVISELSLPIGDVVWVPRNRTDTRQMFVLDFIVERKGINDLASSIKDHR